MCSQYISVMLGLVTLSFVEELFQHLNETLKQVQGDGYNIFPLPSSYSPLPASP